LKRIIQILLLGISFSYYSQNKCKECDSLINKSKNEYDYLSYEKYYKNCLSADTFYYDGPVISKNKSTALNYIVTNKNNCNTYYSIKKFETKTKKFLFGYEIENGDTAYYPLLESKDVNAIMNKIYEHFSLNQTYPKECREENITGVVYITFIVGENGKVKKIHTIKGPHKLLMIEAERLVKTMPVLPQIKYNGRYVNVRLYLPIRFSLKSKP
jgi:TonB family protein